MKSTVEEIARRYQVVTAEIRFLTEEEGGRRTSIDMDIAALYRPHFVVQDQTTRKAIMDGNAAVEPYIAMTFIDGPKEYRNGESGVFRFYCPYWMHPQHPALDAGTEFTIREGAKIVAGGTVIETTEPEKNAGRPIENDDNL